MIFISPFHQKDCGNIYHVSIIIGKELTKKGYNIWLLSNRKISLN